MSGTPIRRFRERLQEKEILGAANSVRPRRAIAPVSEEKPTEPPDQKLVVRDASRKDSLTAAGPAEFDVQASVADVSSLL